MFWAKKNGGVISLYVSVLLGIVGMVIASSLVRMQYRHTMEATADARHRLHLLYLEMIYTIRNEIYDEYYSSLFYESGDIAVDITFDKKNKVAKLTIGFEGETRVHGFLYDKECRCIVSILEKKELVNLEFNANSDEYAGDSVMSEEWTHEVDE